MGWRQPGEDCPVIGVRPIVCVDVPDVHHLPGRFTGLKEYVIQTVAEEDATPGPADLVRGGMSVLVYFAEGIQPVRADIPDLMRMFGGVEIACDDGRAT